MLLINPGSWIRGPTLLLPKVSHSFRDTPFKSYSFVPTDNSRSRRSNRGKGGAVAQLQTFGDLIVGDNRREVNNPLEDLPVNAMAPVEKKQKRKVRQSF